MFVYQKVFSDLHGTLDTGVCEGRSNFASGEQSFGQGAKTSI